MDMAGIADIAGIEDMAGIADGMAENPPTGEL